MASNLTLLGALAATQNLTIDDVILLADYLEYADGAGIDPASVMSAVDLALDFFRPTPDEDAAITATAAESTVRHDHDDMCPDCGGEMMDEVDVDQAVELWRAVRMVADKYTFDREYDGGHGEPEEC